MVGVTLPSRGLNPGFRDPLKVFPGPAVSRGMNKLEIECSGCGKTNGWHMQDCPEEASLDRARESAIKTLYLLGPTPESDFRDALKREGHTESDSMGIVSRLEREGVVTRTKTRGWLVLTKVGLRKAGVCL